MEAWWIGYVTAKIFTFRQIPGKMHLVGRDDSCLFFLDNPYVMSLNDSPYFNQIIKFSMWMGVALTVWLFPRIRPKGNSG